MAGIDIWRDVRREENQFDKRDLRKLPGPLTFDEIKRRLAEEKRASMHSEGYSCRCFDPTTMPPQSSEQSVLLIRSPERSP